MDGPSQFGEAGAILKVGVENRFCMNFANNKNFSDEGDMAGFKNATPLFSQTFILHFFSYHSLWHDDP
jgi:hypothetical protein